MFHAGCTLVGFVEGPVLGGDSVKQQRSRGGNGHTVFG